MIQLKFLFYIRKRFTKKSCLVNLCKLLYFLGLGSLEGGGGVRSIYLQDPLKSVPN